VRLAGADLTAASRGERTRIRRRRVGRPERGEAVRQVPGVLGRVDLQDEQRVGDGHDRITERDQPRWIALDPERR
jgi:hypothetical protein